MKWLINLTDKTQLNNYDPAEFEFYIECVEFSRFGKLPWDKALERAKEATAKHFDVYLQFDLLLKQQQFDSLGRLLTKDNLKHFAAVRVQDPGVAEYFKSFLVDIPLHLILETGHHNLESIKAWQQYLAKQLQRIVLSPELPKNIIAEYKNKLETPVELLGAGRLLLFYTPRQLLKAQFVAQDDPEVKRMLQQEFLEIEGASEESPHKGFPILENSHGTFMFLPKDFYILDQIAELREMDVDYLRVNFSHFENAQVYENHLVGMKAELLAELRFQLPNKSIKGFFNTNKSDVLFPKLRNKLILREDRHYCGEVLEVKKKDYVAINIHTAMGLAKGQTVTFYSPDGRVKVHSVASLKNSLGQQVASLDKNEIAFLPHIGGVSVKTKVYFGEDPFALK